MVWTVRVFGSDMDGPTDITAHFFEPDLRRAVSISVGWWSAEDGYKIHVEDKNLGTVHRNHTWNVQETYDGTVVAEVTFGAEEVAHVNWHMYVTVAGGLQGSWRVEVEPHDGRAEIGPIEDSGENTAAYMEPDFYSPRTVQLALPYAGHWTHYQDAFIDFQVDNVLLAWVYPGPDPLAKLPVYARSPQQLNVTDPAGITTECPCRLDALAAGSHPGTYRINFEGFGSFDGVQYGAQVVLADVRPPS